MLNIDPISAMVGLSFVVFLIILVILARVFLPDEEDIKKHYHHKPKK
jgi:hypothetical protein